MHDDINEYIDFVNNFVVEVVGECFKFSSDIGDDDFIVLILTPLKNLMRIFMMILML